MYYNRGDCFLIFLQILKYLHYPLPLEVHIFEYSVQQALGQGWGRMKDDTVLLHVTLYGLKPW
jgi:hypothetical protein